MKRCLDRDGQLWATSGRHQTGWSALESLRWGVWGRGGYRKRGERCRDDGRMLTASSRDALSTSLPLRSFPRAANFESDASLQYRSRKLSRTFGRGGEQPLHVTLAPAFHTVTAVMRCVIVVTPWWRRTLLGHQQFRIRRPVVVSAPAHFPPQTPPVFCTFCQLVVMQKRQYRGLPGLVYSVCTQPSHRG